MHSDSLRHGPPAGTTTEGRRAELTARALLTLAALLPYWRLLTFGVIYVTDDIFTSDIFNGELPGRVLIGALIRQGDLPVWTSALCSGFPLAGAFGEPISLAAFSLLPPAAALDLLVIVLLLVAAHGTYGLARRFGADRSGAVLAGLAFSGSGYVACQLKHLAILSTVVWLPVGLGLLDRVLAPARGPALARRAFHIAVFGIVFAEQVLAGFPQSAYICALVYGSFAVFRAFTNPQYLGRVRLSLVLLLALGLVVLLAAAAGAVVVLPLWELGATSDRIQPMGWQWSTTGAYWPWNALTFLVPYINGDISDNTYRGPSLFWEDYAYVGIVPFLLALYASTRGWRRPLVVFAVAMTVVAYLMALGPASFVFRAAYVTLPGMDLFRFPTRFLIVVELGLALLGAVGLTHLQEALARRFSPVAPQVAWVVAVALCVAAALDLYVQQPRQNPMVWAGSWLEPPGSVALVGSDGAPPRTFTPQHDDLHKRAFFQARGWTNLAPYYGLRDVLQPNTGGGYWGTPSADCYAGISPRWSVDVWGDHNRKGLVVADLATVDFKKQTLWIRPGLTKVLGAFGATHVLSLYPAEGTPLPLIGHQGAAYVYRVDGSARVRVVGAARHVGGNGEAAARLLAPDFDPDREILLHDAPNTVGPRVEDVNLVVSGVPETRAFITRESSREVVIDAYTPDDGFLLLADTFYPGWSAAVDGSPVPTYRANISVRGVQLPKGRHVVRFTYEAPGFFRGLRITAFAISGLFLWMSIAVYLDRPPHRRLKE